MAAVCDDVELKGFVEQHRSLKLGRYEYMLEMVHFK